MSGLEQSSGAPVKLLNIHRKFQNMFPGIGDGHSRLDHGDREGHLRDQQRHTIEQETAKNTLETLQGQIGYTIDDFENSTEKFFKLDRKDGEIVVYPGNCVRYVCEKTGEEVFTVLDTPPAA